MRFEVTEVFDIKDNLTGKIYILDATNEHPKILCDLLNEINDRADRNAELVDMSMINLLFKLDQLEEYYNDVQVILKKYNIQDLEKLDKCLMVGRVW